MNTNAGRILPGLAVAAVTLSTDSPASAMPPFLNEWSDLYPTSLTDENLDNGGASSCQVCHAEPFGGSLWNAYGWDVRLEFNANGEDIVAAIMAVQDLSPDNDPTACSSIVEIMADTQPGWTDGLNNTFYLPNGSTLENQPPPPDFLGDLDPSTSCCPADLDGDGVVAITDLLALLSAWGPCPDPPLACPGDVDTDNDVGITDLLVLLGGWGRCP